MYSQTNALTCKDHTTAVHRGSIAIMAPELIIEELSMTLTEIDELKTVEVWAVLMTFFKILNPGQSYPFQSDFPNILTSNMEEAFKNELQNKLILPLV